MSPLRSRAERALDSAALAGDVPATDRRASDFIAAWSNVLAAGDLASEILCLTVDQWCTRPDKPTILLDTPNGEVLFVADRDAHARAVEAGRVVFSPLEVEKLALAGHEKLAGSDFVPKLIETKRTFLGARIEEVRTGEACQTTPVPTNARDTGDGDANGPCVAIKARRRYAWGTGCELGGRPCPAARLLARDSLECLGALAGAVGAGSIGPMGRTRRRTGPPRSATNALGRWIDRKELHRDTVAERLGISRRYLDRLCSNTRRPDLELAIAIEDLTKGQVSVRTWLEAPKHSGD